MTKPNCYACKHSGQFAGTAHLHCKHPNIGDIFKAISIGPARLQEICDDFEIQASYHGIKNGWFDWPFDFDPTWLENCNKFEEKNNVE